MVVYSQTSPRVKSSILLLLFGQRYCSPVGKALSLRYLFIENDGIYLLKAGGLNTERLDIVLKFEEVFRINLRPLVQSPYVIAKGNTNLHYIIVHQETQQRAWHTDYVKPEKKTDIIG